MGLSISSRQCDASYDKTTACGADFQSQADGTEGSFRAACTNVGSEGIPPKTAARTA